MKALICCTALFLSFSPLRAAMLQLWSPEYSQASSAQDKQDYLWEKVSNGRWATLPQFGEPTTWAEKWQSIKAVASVGSSFGYASDEMPEGRIKLLHPYGSVAKIEFLANQESPYTGIFEGRAVGLARISLAKDPSDGYAPGIAVKFLVDGYPSLNIHVMEKLAGQGDDKNVFAKEFTNVLPEPSSTVFKIAVWYFELFVDNAIHLKMDHLAGMTALGEKVTKPVVPHQIFLAPTQEVQYDSLTDSDFREDLSTIPAGSKMYDVWAKKSADGPRQHIGAIFLQSEFVASEYGDKVLHFEHSQ